MARKIEKSKYKGATERPRSSIEDLKKGIEDEEAVFNYEGNWDIEKEIRVKAEHLENTTRKRKKDL